MKKNVLFTAIMFSLPVSAGLAQINYPFMDTRENRDILAYWYNVPKNSVKLEVINQKFNFESSLEIYGKAPEASFQIKAEVYSKNGQKVFDRSFEVQNRRCQKPCSIEFKKSFFRLRCPVEHLNENPDKIIVTIQSSKTKRTKEIKCRYHKLYGKVTDFEGRAFEGFIVVCPEGFLNVNGIGVLCNSSGNYQIELPERTYNCIVATDESYGIKTLEVWAWHIIMDNDQQLDFKVGTGEVYNLNVWTTNGSYNTYYVSFRPMMFSLTNIKEKEYPHYFVTLNKNQFQVADDSPPLEPNKDIKVKVNGKEAKIISLQKFYQTGELDKPAHVVYVAQISRKGLSRTGKQTIIVEFEKEMEIGEKRIIRNSMGYYQFYLNYKGLSHYY